VASAPGRVTILGEHTDYNEGTSLGVATPQRTTVTARPADPDTVQVRSVALGTGSCSIARPGGPAFVVLAAALAREAGVDGVRLDVTSDLPIGAGLSSSASYAVAVALALGLDRDHVTIARVCQAAERAAGSDVGLLDPLVILAALDRRVVDIDFTGPVITTFELHAAIGLTAVDTGERRALASSPYAARRAECVAAADRIGPLGHATRAALAHLDDEILLRRARHVVSECERVALARRALACGDVVRVGQLLDEGHESLRDDFEVSTPQVEAVRRELNSLPGVTGSRLCGGGFGGCLVAAHDPDVALQVSGRWSTRLVGAAGASLSAAR
jgi:galactokinase